MYSPIAHEASEGTTKTHTETIEYAGYALSQTSRLNIYEVKGRSSSAKSLTYTNTIHVTGDNSTTTKLLS
jgi:hypothetical protein